MKERERETCKISYMHRIFLGLFPTYTQITSKRNSGKNLFYTFIERERSIKKKEKQAKQLCKMEIKKWKGEREQGTNIRDCPYTKNKRNSIHVHVYMWICLERCVFLVWWDDEWVSWQRDILLLAFCEERKKAASNRMQKMCFHFFTSIVRRSLLILCRVR